MRVTRVCGGLAIAAVAAVLVASAGAGTTGKPAAIRLTSVAGAKAYLRSIGLNPRKFVVQTGKHNYAGSACPGRAWHCTRARHVIQFAAGGGSNKSECTSGFTYPEGQPTCVVVQTSTNGTNTARCIERDSSPSLSQDCEITQTNTYGNNSALVDQSLVQTDPAVQGNQNASIQQSNQFGDNSATTNQSIDQHTNTNGAGKGAADTAGQQQSSGQFSDVEQDNGTGKNSSKRSQDVSQLAQAKGGTQEQDDEIRASVNQSGSGGSTNSNSQHEHQNAVGGDEQTQFGPLSCCSSQNGNPQQDKCEIKQNAEQHATSDTAFQNNELAAQYFTDGNCHATQHVTENGSTANNEQSGQTIGIFIACGNFGDAPTASSSNNGVCTPFTGGGG